MMGGLVADIFCGIVNTRLADGENGVAILPSEMIVAGVKLFQIHTTATLYLLNHLGYGYLARQHKKGMYVVSCTTHDYGGTSKFVDGCANIGMQMLGSLLGYSRARRFDMEDEMDIYFTQ